MKYYTLKYVSSLRDGFGGMAKLWKIEILGKYKGDKGLLEHEKFHVREWWFGLLAALLLALVLWAFVHPAWGWLALAGPWVQGTLYRAKWYRRWSEIRAYRIQLAVGNYASPQFAVNALMHKYRLGMSEREARKALQLD